MVFQLEDCRLAEPCLIDLARIVLDHLIGLAGDRRGLGNGAARFEQAAGQSLHTATG